MRRGLGRIILVAGALFTLVANARAENLGGDASQGAFVGGLIGSILGSVESPAKMAVRGSQKKSDPAARRTIQEALRFLGYYKGQSDGVFGAQTAAAVRRFQVSVGKRPTGALTQDEVLFLLGQYSTALAKQRDPAMGPDTSMNGSSNNLAVPDLTADIDQAHTASYSSAEIYASRLFAGPEDYPPGEFAAYGILAFKSRASPHDRARQVMICEAYVNSIRPFQLVGKPTTEQMVTIWPIESRRMAAEVSSLPENAVCEKAVEHYGSLMADRALRHADAARAELTGLGPYLLAWSPPKNKGEPDAIVLVADLSDVDSYASALDVMLNWVQDIERDPKLWSNGWTIEALRVKAQKWFDRRGSQLLLVFGG